MTSVHLSLTEGGPSETADLDDAVVEALVATGDMVQARSRAAACRKQHPSGLLLPSRERALEGDQARER